MPLSEYEQRVLEQMEQQLRSDDPRLAKAISGGVPRRPLHVALGGVLVLAGVGLLFIGLWNAQIWLGLLGFVAMFFGVLLALRRPHVREPQPRTAPDENVRQLRPPNRSSFMERLEERWDKRRHDNG